MRDYVSVLTIVIMTCIGLAVIIPMLCLCACLTRFCYVACQQKEPEKKKCSRRRYQVENREPKSGTSQHPVTDSTTVVNVSRNERQITKGQLDGSQSGRELKSRDMSVTGSTPEQSRHL
ncbi:hypothetical protein ACH3XW_42705 [Acanthocheilonema viteae]